jgi:hypothetical protein
MLAGLSYIGLFHGHIYTSIVNVALLNEKPLSPLSLIHRRYTTHFINESLTDDRQACMDEVILAVLTIFNVEVGPTSYFNIECMSQCVEQSFLVPCSQHRFCRDSYAGTSTYG